MFITRRRLLWGTGVVAMLMLAASLVLPAYFAYRFAARLQRRSDDFRLVIAGLRTWDECKGRIPDAVYRNSSGIPCYSWRLSVLRYIESRDYAEEVPWDHERNLELASRPHSVFCSHIGGQQETVETTISAITGSGTAFDDEREVRFMDLPDDLVLLVEVADLGIHWMAPGDLEVGNISPAVTAGTSGKGIMLGFADGTVWFVCREIPVSALEAFFTISGAEQDDRDVTLRPYCIATW